MKKDIEDKIVETLQKQFNGNAEIDRFFDDNTFSYSIRKGDKFPVFQVKFTKDESGLHVDWENAWEIYPYRFDSHEGGDGMSMDGK
jgi:hypothetical protein